MPFVAEIRIFAGSVVPSGWALCDGQLLAISGNTALFSLLGTKFGGNGINNFALPDLRGRVPIGPGQGNGLSYRYAGESGGAEALTLSAGQLPAHAHALRASAGNGTSPDPANGTLARNPAAIPNFRTPADVNMAAGAVANNGGSQPHNNMQPFLTVSYIIALQGEWPSPG